jgi:dsRNA-specific ribonuclease
MPVPSSPYRRLADAFEAVAAALYLDARENAFPLVRRLMDRPA